MKVVFANAVLLFAYICIVGKESKNVYVIPGQGGMNAYQIQDSQQPTTLKGRSLRSNP